MTVGEPIRTVTLKSIVNWPSIEYLQDSDGVVLEVTARDWWVEIIGVNGKPCESTNHVRYEP